MLSLGKILLTHFFSKIKDLFYTTLFFDLIFQKNYFLTVQKASRHLIIARARWLLWSVKDSADCG